MMKDAHLICLTQIAEASCHHSFRYYKDFFAQKRDYKFYPTSLPVHGKHIRGKNDYSKQSLFQCTHMQTCFMRIFHRDDSP